MSAETLKPGNIRIAEEADYVSRVLRGERHLGIETGLTPNLDGYQGIPCVGRVIYNKRLTGGYDDMSDICFSLTRYSPHLRAVVRMAGIHPAALSKVEVVATLVGEDQTPAIDIIPHIDQVVANSERASGVLNPGYIRGRIRLMPAFPKKEGLLSIISFDQDGKPIVPGSAEHVFAFALEQYGLEGSEGVNGFNFDPIEPDDLFKELCLVAFSPNLKKLR